MDHRLRHYRSSWDLHQCGWLEQERFRSKWYLGLSRGMQWLRLTVNGTAQMHIRVYTCDDPPDDFRDVEDRPVLERTAEDLLLYEAKGRYLAFTAEPGEALRSFTLSFPGRSIAEGLPIVLQNDDTLRTLLAVCQSEYLDLTAEMHEFPTRLNPAHPNALPQLPGWIGAQQWMSNCSAAKKILPHIPLLTRLRGTRRGLQLLATLATGFPCRIMETHGCTDGCAWEAHQQGTATSEEISILIPPCANPKDVQYLRMILPDFIPFGVSYTLVHLEEGAPMDGHSYLDENSVLIEPSICEMDGTDIDGTILE